MQIVKHKFALLSFSTPLSRPLYSRSIRCVRSLLFLIDKIFFCGRFHCCCSIACIYARYKIWYAIMYPLKIRVVRVTHVVQVERLHSAERVRLQFARAGAHTRTYCSFFRSDRLIFTVDCPYKYRKLAVTVALEAAAAVQVDDSLSLSVSVCACETTNSKLWPSASLAYVQMWLLLCVARCVCHASSLSTLYFIVKAY